MGVLFSLIGRTDEHVRAVILKVYGSPAKVTRHRRRNKVTALEMSFHLSPGVVKTSAPGAGLSRHASGTYMGIIGITHKIVSAVFTGSSGIVGTRAVVVIELPCGHAHHAAGAGARNRLTEMGVKFMAGSKVLAAGLALGLTGGIIIHGRSVLNHMCRGRSGL